MMSLDLASLITNLGFPIAMVIYLLMRDKKRDAETRDREKRLSERIDVLEDEHRRELVGLVNNTATAVEASTAVNRELLNATRNMHTSVTALVSVMQLAPCHAATKRTPSDRLVLDPEVEEAIRHAKIRSSTDRPIPPPATEERYEPHPSSFEIPDPGKPPQTPRPISRREAREDEQRRHRSA